jgi:Ser/Thr protein kinase RdoA (MazF antagonist)
MSEAVRPAGGGKRVESLQNSGRNHNYLVRNLKERMERLRTLDAGEKRAEIDPAQFALVDRLDALDRAVTDRILVSARRQARIQRIGSRPAATSRAARRPSAAT